jgi:hypothetical protein
MGGCLAVAASFAVVASLVAAAVSAASNFWLHRFLLWWHDKLEQQRRWALMLF